MMENSSFSRPHPINDPRTINTTESIKNPLIIDPTTARVPIFVFMNPFPFQLIIIVMYSIPHASAEFSLNRPQPAETDEK